MIEKLRQFFTLRTLLIINVLLVVFILGTDEFFFDTGLIHGISIFFIFLAILSLTDRPVGDAFLSRFLQRSTAWALLCFATAHALEFLQIVFKVGILPKDGGLVNILNLHAAGLLAIILGASFIFKVYSRKLYYVIATILTTLVVGFLLVTIFLLTLNYSVSLESTSVIPQFYLWSTISILIIGLLVLTKIRMAIPILKTFSVYFMLAFFFIAIAEFMVLFSHSLEAAFDIEWYDVAYYVHFAFYLSLSFLYLTSARLSSISPYYKEAEEFSKRQVMAK